MTWRLIYVRPLSEKKVIAALAEINRGIDAYCPQERVWRGIGARRKPTDRMLLPGMVFANLPDDENLLTFIKHQVEGVSYVIGNTMRGTMQLGDFVGQLRLVESSGAFDKTISRKTRLKVGQKVLISAGVGAGHAAVIIGMSHSRRAKLIADVYGSPKRLSADEADLEAVEEREAA